MRTAFRVMEHFDSSLLFGNLSNSRTLADVSSMFITTNGFVAPHLDRNDLNSVIQWYHRDDTYMGGGFYIYSLGVGFVPRDTTLLYTMSQKLVHGSAAPVVLPPGRARVGLALANRKHVHTAAKNQIKRGNCTWLTGLCIAIDTEETQEQPTAAKSGSKNVTDSSDGNTRTKRKK